MRNFIEQHKLSQFQHPSLISKRADKNLGPLHVLRYRLTTI